MKRLILRVKAKDTVNACVTVSPLSLTGTIVKNQDYTGTSNIRHTLSISNSCNTAFTLPARTLFSQSDANGSTFRAYMNATPITANGTATVNIYYDGIYKGDSELPSYSFVLSAFTVNVGLTVTIPDTVGTIIAINDSSNNRQDFTYSFSHFLNAYNDPDGDTIESVKFFGDVSRIRYNGAAVTVNQVIPFANIDKVKVLAPDSNNKTVISFDYSVIDSKGNTIT